MISLARGSRGLTQKELVEKSNGILSQAALSKIEQGLTESSIEIINEIARITNYPVKFFFEDYIPYSHHSVYHRKRKTIARSILKRIDDNTEIKILHIQKLLVAVDIPDDSFPPIDPDLPIDPLSVARSARQYFKCPKGPIKSIVEIIERAGGIIIPCNFGTPKMDGFTMFIDKTPPLIFINKDMTGDRWRWTLGHELGHIIMHLHRFVQDEEAAHVEADQFASEFLMPEDDIRYQLHSINLDKLAALKKYWKVSMAALLKRAQSLRLLSPRMARQNWMLLSSKGWRLREPPETDIPIEKPLVFEKLLQIHRDELGYTTEEFAEMLRIPIEDFEENYQPKPNPKPRLNLYVA